MSDYDQNAANDAGYAAGAVEGGFDRAGNEVREDAQDVENIPSDIGNAAERGYDNTVEGVENIPSDIGGAVSGVASKIGQFFGGAENEGREAEQNVQNEYNQASNEVDQYGQSAENEYKQTSNDVDQYGQSVQNSYDEGENQGRQQGW